MCLRAGGIARQRWLPLVLLTLLAWCLQPHSCRPQAHTSAVPAQAKYSRVDCAAAFCEPVFSCAVTVRARLALGLRPHACGRAMFPFLTLIQASSITTLLVLTALAVIAFISNWSVTTPRIHVQAPRWAAAGRPGLLHGGRRRAAHRRGHRFTRHSGAGGSEVAALRIRPRLLSTTTLTHMAESLRWCWCPMLLQAQYFTPVVAHTGRDGLDGDVLTSYRLTLQNFSSRVAANVARLH